MIDRTHSRQFLPKSSSLRTLRLCVEFSDSLRPTSVVPTTYALPLATAAPQPVCNQSLTHSFYLDGGGYPSSRPANLRTFCRSNWFPGYPLSFAFFCTPQKPNSFIFKRFRTLCKKTGGGGISAIRKFLRCSWKFSLVKVGNSLRSTARQSRVTSHQARTRVSQNQPKMEGLSLCVSAFDLESLAESAELQLAMVFVMGRLVRPYHGFR